MSNPKPQINQSFTRYNYTSGNAGRKFIVLHYTAGNGDTAKNNIDYFNSKYVGASAHFFCDPTSIWQNVDLKNTSWHCGAKVYYSTCRNSNSIGIEMCSRKDKYGNYYIEEATVKNAIALTKWLMDEFDIPIQNVIRHYDVTHKCCPAPWVNNPAQFDSFKASLLSAEAFEVKTGVYEVTATNLNVRSGPSVNYGKVGVLTNGTKVEVTDITYGWGKIEAGYICMDYAKFVSELPGKVKPHWGESFLKECQTNKWIETPEAWTDYDAYTTKSCCIAFIDKITGGTWPSEQADPKIHWVHPSIISLCGKDVINEPEQWIANPDGLISKAMWLALIVKSKGGVSDLYKDRKADHWGRNCLDTLCDMGVIETPKSWCDDFDAPVTKAMVIASACKAYNR